MKHELIRESLAAVHRNFKDFPVEVDCHADPICISSSRAIGQEQRQALEEAAKSMVAWRKGPYDLFGYQIDSEWLGQVKWERMDAFIPDLTNKQVADIGCSNGYYMFKLLTKNPERIVGFDPFQICKYQFDFINYFVREHRLEFLLKGVEDLGPFRNSFDFILYMGVLYHRRDPVGSLKLIAESLKPEGSMLLETMILPGESSEVIEITDRYSKMKNIYYLSTLGGLIDWLQEAGFKSNRLLSVSKTNVVEQRVSELAPYQSLSEFLDAENSDLTVEGLAAPRRVLILSSK